MENQDALESGNGLLVDDLSLSDYNFDAGNSLDNDTSLCEKLLLEEVESYWDDINSRLTVSRMVSDSVIKGIVNAIELEADKRVASKDSEIAALHERLQFYESVMAKENRLDETMRELEASTKMVEPLKVKSGLYQHSLGEGMELSCIDLSELKVAAQDHLKWLKEEIKNIRSTHLLSRAKVYLMDKELCSILVQQLNVIDECADALGAVLAATHQQIDDTYLSLKNLISEQEWEHKFQREISAIVVQSLIREHQDDFEGKVSEQKILVDTFTKNWQKTIDELSTMRQELDDISASLLSSEPGLVVSHHSLTDVAKMTISDSSQLNLKHMTNDELVAYYKSEITKMKRQYDSVLQEKTEEWFSLKREYLKEKGGNALHFRRDKENELLKKKISGFISMLDNIILENEKSLIVQGQQNMLHSLNQRINILLFENQQLKCLLIDKAEEVICTNSQVLNVVNQSANCSQVEEDFLEHSKEVKLDVEDVKSETIIRDRIQKIVLRELVGELAVEMEYLDLECRIAQDISFILFKEYLKDVISSINHFMEKHYKEKDSFAVVVVEKEKALSLVMEENKKLKHEKQLLLTLIKEKEKSLLETEVKIMKQKEHHDNVCHEIDMLRNQLSNQSLYISESKKKNDSVKEKLAETLQQVQQYEAELGEINQKYKVVSDTLKELEKQNKFLHHLVEEKQMKLASAVAKEQEHLKFMTTATGSITGLSETILQFECRLANKLVTNESRLESLSHQCSDLFQQANFLKRKACWYKQGFERRCSDLQKAEAEVDLLGDEVDVLLRLLEKIYIALEHYSPVLQHYPGVVEILKLIRREMKSNSI